MNVVEINPGTNGTLAHYAETAIREQIRLFLCRNELTCITSLDHRDHLADYRLPKQEILCRE